MLSSLRKMADTWPARILFMILAAAFVGWGVSGKMSLGGVDPTSVANVGGKPISNSAFDSAFRQDMERIGKRFGDASQIPPAVRRSVAQQTLARLVTQQALDNEARRLGVVAPDSAVQKAIKAMPAFQGVDGSFDHATYIGVLAQNNMSPVLFQSYMQMDIAKNQVLAAVQAGARPSDMLTRMVYDYLNEGRQADLVSLSFASHTPPAAPADTVLQRYYANNPKLYTAPEYRRIKAVILSPATIGRGLKVTDADMKTWFSAHKSEFDAPEKRSLQVVTAGTKPVADKLAALWTSGAAWPVIEAAAKAAGASTAELDDTTRDGVPAPELAAAAFAAPVNAVTGPVTEPLGFQVVKVTAVTPAKNPSLADLHDDIRQRIGTEKAADLIDARAQKLQDLFAGGSHIDEVPADLGAVGAEGTLDAQGMTPEGTKAPIPAPDKLRSAIIAEAFKLGKGETGQLIEGPDHAWYAVAVEDVTKPAVKPFDAVRAKVLADWQAAQIRHDTETQAAKLVGTVNGGQTILNAAWGSGQQVTRSPVLKRNHPVQGVPAELNQLIFTLKPGQATMVESNVGFLVARLAQVVKADPKSDPSGLADVRQSLTHALADDYLVSFATAVREEAKPVVNSKVLDQMIQTPGE
jgi:peptidyl-prolyl cis-trans isomerase D